VHTTTRFARDAAVVTVVLLVVLALPVVTAAVTVERAAWQRRGESATQTRPHA
jgi:hypothetical protein